MVSLPKDGWLICKETEEVDGWVVDGRAECGINYWEVHLMAQLPHDFTKGGEEKQK